MCDIDRYQDRDAKGGKQRYIALRGEEDGWEDFPASVREGRGSGGVFCGIG